MLQILSMLSLMAIMVTTVWLSGTKAPWWLFPAVFIGGVATIFVTLFLLRGEAPYNCYEHEGCREERVRRVCVEAPRWYSFGDFCREFPIEGQ